MERLVTGAATEGSGDLSASECRMQAILKELSKQNMESMNVILQNALQRVDETMNEIADKVHETALKQDESDPESVTLETSKSEDRAFFSVF